MPFVKLDCGILNSTLWFERTAREIFITALLMAEPLETLEPRAEISTRNLDLTGWIVPPGWYGFVPAAGVGILHRAGIEKTEQAMAALESLARPEDASRSKEFDGRRLVRIDGGFIILNYMKYRERDYTAAERAKRYRDRLSSRRNVTPSHRDITQAEAEAEGRSKDLKLVTPDVASATKTGTPTSAAKKSPKPNGRSKHPIFQGQRFVVFDWMLEDIGRILGTHLDNFDIDAWFYALDARAVEEKAVKAKDAWWPWLQAELVLEASKRGLTGTPANDRAKKEAAENAEVLRLVRESDARAAKGIGR